jgi:hypothetical protein
LSVSTDLIIMGLEAGFFKLKTVVPFSYRNKKFEDITFQNLSKILEVLYYANFFKQRNYVLSLKYVFYININRC